MDFHGLARRQLQALCKLNKIPANMTNVAMADAISALENVVGIEEVMQPQSPGREESGLSEGPRITRTSTRPRKPRVKSLESGGIVSQSRARSSRKLVDDDDDEYVVKTPAVASCKKSAPAAASLRKTEVPSVQKVYSTRRSVRLVEKQMSELCLGEIKSRTRPVKIHDELSSEITERDDIRDNLGIGSYEMSVQEVIDDEVNSKNVAALVETIGNGGAVEGYKVSSNGLSVAASSEIVEEEVNLAMGNVEKELKIAEHLGVEEEAEPEKFVDSLIVSDGVCDLRMKEEVAIELAIDDDNRICINATSDSVVVVEEEASFKVLADNEKVPESINEMMIMETEASKQGSDLSAASKNGNSKYLEEKAELVAENSTEIVSAMEYEIVEAPACQLSSAMDNSTHDLSDHVEVEDSTEDSRSQEFTKSSFLSVEHIKNENSSEDSAEVLDSSELKFVTVGKKLDAHSPASEQTADLIKELPLEMKKVDKENTVKSSLVGTECFKVPKKPAEEMSIRELQKLLKGMNVSNTCKKDKEGDANKYQHQDTPRPTRKALEILPDNTQL